MTTNKAEGRTLDFVAIYLPEYVFSHGQLYVALSRVQRSASLGLLLNNVDGYTKHIAYPEVLKEMVTNKYSGYSDFYSAHNGGRGLLWYTTAKKKSSLRVQVKIKYF